MLATKFNSWVKAEIEEISKNQKKMNRFEEFMLPLPTTASTNYYPNKKPNSYKFQAPAALDLLGTWEVEIVKDQTD